ncbi:cation diffusion facilitator family transporter [Halocatena pleomorpha]|uniref:Cation transporter n=1 Tax=Halocatena pleomorpha TaxID=1785090 RepID=A0A3P3R7K4_9EURY|nr:cation diffusion facilitator family transporter [Halocatena pleomorpha]RRJ29432.1 cation transporter [Halocatena pleomorpha]
MVATREAFLRVSWINVLLNALKIAVEGSIGFLTGSIALIADAAHSVADLLASGVVLIWGRSVHKDADESHPHGHNRFEPLSALFVGGVLVLLGLKLLYDASLSLFTGVTAEYSIWLVAGLLFALVDMYVCYWYTHYVNQDLQLPSLHALATDSRNDIYTTGAALVGVLGMAIGYPIFDSIAGGTVSLLVIHQGIEISQENIRYLADSAPPETEQKEIKGRIREHPEVRGIHDFVAYYSGHVIEVEVHAEVDRGLTVVEAHDIESELRDRIRDIELVSDVHIHLDPVGLSEWEGANDATPASTGD